MTLLDAIRRYASTHPQAPAVLAADGSATYRSLVDRAATLAAAYRRHGVVAGDRVGIVLPPGREAVAAAVAAFAVGASYVPVDPSQPRARAASMLRRCAPRLCLSTEPTRIGDLTTTTPQALAGLWGAPPAPHTPPLAGSGGHTDDDVAYVIHTSGSSGTPKGIEVEHRGLRNLITDLDRRAPVPGGYVGAWWCSPDFDVAVWEQWAPLSRGGAVAVVPPADRWDADRLAAFLDSAEVASAYVPPAFLPGLRDHLAARPRSGGSLRRLLVGVEPIPLGLLQEIRRLRPGIAIVNGYGPAETTVCCTLYLVPAEGGYPADRTPIGTAVRGNRLTLLDEDGQPTTGAGELVVTGTGVARGYLDGPAGGFGPPAGSGAAGGHDPATDPDEVPGTRAYRTGDRVRTLPDGNLVFVGRVDRQLKIRGYRVEPAEIESAVRLAAGVREVVVDQRDVAGVGAAAVAYLVPGQPWLVDPPGLRDRLAELLPAYAIPAAFLALDRLPLTPNGKVDHDALRRLPIPDSVAPPPAGEAETGTRTATGGPAAGTPVVGSPPASGPAGSPPAGHLPAVRQAWQEALGREVAGREGFIALGGTSLSAARAAAALRAATGRAVSAADVLSARSADDLVARLDAVPPAAPGSLATGHTRGPLSLNQLGLWLHDTVTAPEPTYLEALTFTLDGGFDVTRLAAAVEAAAATRPAFGAALDLDGVEPQLVLGRHRISLDVRTVPPGVDPAELVRHELARPVRLDGGPLARFVLFNPAHGAGVLLLAWHHLVVDGWTVRQFLDEVGRCYRCPGHRPTPPAPTLCDATTWLREVAADPRTIARARRVIAHLGTPVWLPTGRGGGSLGEPGPAVEVTVDTASTESIEVAARRAGIAPSAFFCAAYQIAVAGMLGPDRFTLGCAVAGRTQPDLGSVAGYLVNTVLMPFQLMPGRSAAALVADTAYALRWARDSQEGIPFPVLVSQLRAAGCAVPAQIPGIYLSVDDDYLLDLDGRIHAARTPPLRRAKFGAMLALRHRPSTLSGVFEYRTGLLPPVRAEGLVERFATALGELAQLT